MPDLDGFLVSAYVDPAVFALRPDYRVVLVAVDGIEPGRGVDLADDLRARAEASAADALADVPVTDVPHVAAWRDAYRAFGAKPQRTRNSLESLMRRAATGLPRVNPLTDVYNAISVLHRVPLGGEDSSRATRVRRGSSARPVPSRSTPPSTARPSSSIPSRARSCGPTRRASRAAAGTGGRAAAPR